MPGTTEEARAAAKTRLLGRLGYVNEQLASKPFLLGEQFSVADGYLFTVTNWARPTGLDISSLTNLGAFMARVAARPAVQEAMKAEGLLK